MSLRFWGFPFSSEIQRVAKLVLTALFSRLWAFPVSLGDFADDLSGFAAGVGDLSDDDRDFSDRTDDIERCSCSFSGGSRRFKPSATPFSEVIATVKGQGNP
jgi:hypothetical protein